MKGLLVKIKLSRYLREFKDLSGYIYIKNKNKIILNKGFGYSNYEANLPNTIDTRFKIGSITKQFTAMGIMILQEKELLHVTDKLSKYIPDYPNGEDISLHDLLSMTSGIPNYLNDLMFDFYNIENGDYNYSKNLNTKFSPVQLIDLFKNNPTNFIPRTQYEYSNSNYILLGYIIELLSGSSYGDFIKENIFIPLNMLNSGYDYDELSLNKSKGYRNIKSNITESSSFNNSIMFSAGGLYSSVADLLKWIQALCNNDLWKKSLINNIFKPYTKIGSSKYAYSYGWIVDRFSQEYLADHSGAVPGFVSYVHFNKNLDRTLIILSNNEEYHKKISSFYNGILDIL